MDKRYLIMILGMAAVTYIPRLVPIIGMSKLDIPRWLVRWLAYIPAAVLSALLAPGLFILDDRLNISLHNPYLLAAVPCFLVALYKRNLFLTVLAGMAAMMVVNSL